MMQRSNTISNIVFVTTLTVVIISTISILFPALIVAYVSPYQDTMPANPFEPGVWAFPVVVVNSALLIFGVLYFKKKLPNIVKKSIQNILDFEVSRRIAFIIMLIVISYYVGLTIHELFEIEIWSDFWAVKNSVENWSFNDGKGIGLQFKQFLLYLSISVFDNIRMVPFLTSILLVILTYFITVKISQKRFSGILAVIVLLQSRLFLEYDTTASYDNGWTILYLFSLYTIYKKWYLSPVAFIFAVASKSLTAIFLPMSLFFIYRSGMPKNVRIKALVTYGVIIGLFLAAFYFVDLPIVSPLKYTSGNFDDIRFWRGLASFAFQLRYDGVVLTLLVPLVVGLYLLSRRGIIQADSIMFIIMGMLLAAPLLAALTNITIQPYRFVPLVVFFAIGAGLLFSKRSTKWSQNNP